MSPFFRGSVRPPRKHPRPWSLNPRLNPDIAKDGNDARASIYDVGNKEKITLPVHNGVYRDAAEKTIGLEPHVVNAASESEMEEQSPATNNSSLHARSIGVARAAETSGLGTVADQAEEEEELDEAFLTARTEKTETQLFGLDDDLKAPKDVQPEAVNVETPGEQPKDMREKEELEIATAPSGIDVPETGESTTGVLPAAEDTVDTGNSSKFPSLPMQIKEVEAAETLTPHAAEQKEAEQKEAEQKEAERTGDYSSSSPAEIQPVEIDQPKGGLDEPRSEVEAVPMVVEEPAIAHPDAASQPEQLSACAHEPLKIESMDTVEAPVIQKDVPTQMNMAGASSVEQRLSLPLEQHQMLDEKPEGEARERQAETDDESAAEAPFVPDHRHTPQSSRKPSQDEESATRITTGGHHGDKPQGPAAAAKGAEEPHVEPSSVEGSIANEEPLMSDEQLNVSDEFRPEVKIKSDAEPAAGSRVE